MGDSEFEGDFLYWVVALKVFYSNVRRLLEKRTKSQKYTFKHTFPDF